MQEAISKIITIFLFFGLFLSTTGCSDQKEEPMPVVAPKKEFKIGLIPEHNLFTQKKRFVPLANYLSQKLDANFELIILSRYGNIIDNFTTNDLDGAFFGSFTGAMAIKKLDVEPLARPESIDGTSTYYGLIFVRKGSGIKNAQDMKGKRFAFVDKATTAGWLLPMHYFQEQGIKDCRSWLGEMYFTGTHEDAIYDVLNGKADIGAAKNTVLSRLAKDDKNLMDKLEILAISPKVPANSLAVKKSLDPDFKKKLKQTLLNMDKDPEGIKILHNFGASRFIETSVADYTPVFEYTEHIGIDLSTYDYTNN